MNTNLVRSKIDKVLMKKQFIEEDLIEIRQRKSAAEEDIADALEALTVAQTVAQLTQQQLEQQLSDIVTPAIQAIFGKPYVFKIKYVQKRKKTEAEIYLVDEQGYEYEPMTDNGGGICDVLALALRIACWKISKPQAAPILIFDEPLKFVSLDFYEDACNFLIEIVKQLELQVVMVTHVKAFIDSADNVVRL